MTPKYPCVLLLACVVFAQSPKKDTALGYDDTPLIPGQKWRVHDAARKRPPIVHPGPSNLPLLPPSDAVVLFAGKDLSNWMMTSNHGDVAPAWTVRDGYIEVGPGTGSLVTSEKFGDCQLHIEWASPVEVKGTSQERGNSGVLLMRRYEIQVLDSYDNPTYADGQAGAVYGQYPPLVNAARKPGEWQSYDIVWEAPRFQGEKTLKPAYVTVFHNGVLLHNHVEVLGPMAHRQAPVYKPHVEEESLMLQNHGSLVRYRNIWIRRIGGYDKW